jgi:glycosyltransferase involved in cell wall biosynthesis
VLWICGDGPLREKTSRDIAARGLGDSVKLLGFQQNPYALMRQATVFVMTSDHEGLPNALIEAQGLGIPAVSTRCPYGPDEIIEDGKTGILVNVGDSRAIAEAIEGLLTNPQRRKEMAEAARNRARSLFDKSTLIKAWEDVLMERS